jgi:hypothetical protein
MYNTRRPALLLVKRLFVAFRLVRSAIPHRVPKHILSAVRSGVLAVFVPLWRLRLHVSSFIYDQTLLYLRSNSHLFPMCHHLCIITMYHHYVSSFRLRRSPLCIITYLRANIHLFTIKHPLIYLIQTNTRIPFTTIHCNTLSTHYLIRTLFKYSLI